MQIIVNIVAMIRRGIRFSPKPKIIGIGPIMPTTMPEAFVSPESIAVNMSTITPKNISMKLTMNSFKTGGNGGANSLNSTSGGLILL